MNIKFKNILILSLLSIVSLLNAQHKEEVMSMSQPNVYSFAFMADLHISEGSKTTTEAQACVEDINNNKEINFVIIAGDVTEFGNDREIRLAKSVLDKLNKPYYIVAGNHDSKWSESGCNTFAKEFGYEHFEFEAEGIKFIGTNSGPNMRMAPALLPRESVVWLDSIVKNSDPRQPMVFVNHYPMDTSMLNYFQVLDILKQTNIQLVMGGHWHTDRSMNYEGIPGILGRSTQSAGREGAGYNVVSIIGSQIQIAEKLVGKEEKAPWYTMQMTVAEPFYKRSQLAEGKRPDFSVNDKYPEISEIWTIQDDSDIGSAAVTNGKYVVYANTAGEIKALNKSTGSVIWSYKTDGKIYSTPAIEKNRVVVGSTDNNIYCFDLKSGKLNWKHQCDKSVLGSPTIFKKLVYIGASDNRFRALDLKSGILKWSYGDIKGFIESKPLVDDYQVVIGDWANTLYSFDTKSGKLQWKWTNGKGRMLSPAAVWPVKAQGKIFIVTPERLTYAIEATSGGMIWKSDGGRESIGVSPKGDRIYVKTMKDWVNSLSTFERYPEYLWKSDTKIGYDIAPTPITSEMPVKGKDGLIFIPTDKGEIVALNSQDGSIVWRYKFSIALINYIQPLENGQLLVSSMDGKVALMKYK